MRKQTFRNTVGLRGPTGVPCLQDRDARHRVPADAARSRWRIRSRRNWWRRRKNALQRTDTTISVLVVSCPGSAAAATSLYVPGVVNVAVVTAFPSAT